MRVEAVIWERRARATVAAKRKRSVPSMAMKSGRNQRTWMVMQRARMEPRVRPTRSSFHATRRKAAGEISPRDMARMTMVAAWPPVLPPAATIMGM